MFIPFIGAYTVGGVPESLEHDAYIALAGPLTGLGVAAICYVFGLETQSAFWYMAAYVGAFVNLFNMIPTPPFDGGRIAGALSPSLWVGGFVVFLGLALGLHLPLFLVLLFGIMALPGAIAGWRGHKDPRFATMTNAARVRVALWYLVTLFALFYIMSLTAHNGGMQQASFT
jgi:Zn-dependent protease